MTRVTASIIDIRNACTKRNELKDEPVRVKNAHIRIHPSSRSCGEAQLCAAEIGEDDSRHHARQEGVNPRGCEFR